MSGLAACGARSELEPGSPTPPRGLVDASPARDVLGAPDAAGDTGARADATPTPTDAASAACTWQVAGTHAIAADAAYALQLVGAGDGAWVGFVTYSPYAIHAVRVGPDGAPRGEPIVARTVSPPLGPWLAPSLADDGGAAAVVTDPGEACSFVRIGADGVLGPRTLVTASLECGWPSASPGGYVLLEFPRAEGEVRATAVDASGREARAPTTLALDRDFVDLDVATLAGGDYVLAALPHDSAQGPAIQRFDAAGAPRGAGATLGHDDGIAHWGVQLALGSDGQGLVSWATDADAENSYGIWLGRLGPGSTPRGGVRRVATAGRVTAGVFAAVPIAQVRGGALLGYSDFTYEGTRVVVQPLDAAGAPSQAPLQLGTAPSFEEVDPGPARILPTPDGALVVWRAHTVRVTQLVCR